MSGPIAIFIRDLAGGGAGRVILNLSSGFAGRGLRVDLVLARSGGTYIEQLASGVRVVDLGAARTLTSLPGLVGYLKREKPVVLLSCTDWANVVALWAVRLAASRTRVLISTHTAVSQDARRALQFRRRLLPYLVRRFYGWADDMIAVSNGVADDLARTARLDRQRIRVIYNPIDIDAVRALSKVALVHPWFGPDQPPVIVSAGRLVRQKDFSSLIRAFNRVRQRRPVRLLILGEGRERGALEALARELQCDAHVALPGFVANPYGYLARAGVFVLSSAWEGFGNVLVEAMAVGTPVVSTDCPSGPAEILEDGRHGALVPVGDIEALAQAIETTLDHPGSRQARIERVAAFAQDSIVQQYLELMQVRSSSAVT